MDFSAPMPGTPPTPDGWTKTDLHLHSAEDPCDVVTHSATDLLLRARQLGFHAIAITLHGHVLERPELFEAARQLGLTLIPATEARIEGADVVILNISEAEAASLRTLDDLRALRERRGRSLLTFAPHPYFVVGGSIGHRLDHHADCFDAIEFSHFHTRRLNLNRPAERAAQRHGKPLLATSDTHRLDFFGHHFSFVDSPPGAPLEQLFDAIRAHRIRIHSPAWPLMKFARYIAHIAVEHPFQRAIDQLQLR